MYSNLRNGTLATESNYYSNEGSVKITHSYFENVADIFNMKYGNLYIDDCKLKY